MLRHKAKAPMLTFSLTTLFQFLIFKWRKQMVIYKLPICHNHECLALKFQNKMCNLQRFKLVKSCL